MTGESIRPSIRSGVTGRAIFTAGHTLGVSTTTSIRDSEASIMPVTGATGRTGDGIAMAAPLMTPIPATPPPLSLGTEAAARITTGGSSSRGGLEKETVV